jgi:predicted YcjX-like family ATPase
MRTVRVAVTGLSGSGKTVFITALVNQLLNWQRANMPDFPKKKQSYPIKARLVPVPAGRVLFPYDENLRLLCETPPQWPPSTRAASEIHLHVSYRRTKHSGGGVYEPHGHWRDLRLELVDYPGEWIVDVPLRTLDYRTWSARVLADAETPLRRAFAQEWRAAIARAAVNEPFAPAVAADLVAKYRAYLCACRTQDSGLVYLQPGRMLMPAELEGADVLAFCPLPPDEAGSGSGVKRSSALRHVFEERFEQYKRTVVAPFVREYFSRAQTQVVLVDLFRILKAGLASYNDHRRCVEDIIATFRYGTPSWLTRTVLQRLGWPGSIERTVFLATKADHASPMQHANLEKLLRDLVATAELHATGACGDGRIATMIVSSMRSTEAVSGVTEVDGRQVTGLRGVILGDESKGAQAVFPGEVPPAFADDEWDTRQHRFPAFQVKGFPRKHGLAVKHINLDAVLGSMLEGVV